MKSASDMTGEEVLAAVVVALRSWINDEKKEIKVIIKELKGLDDQKKAQDMSDAAIGIAETILDQFEGWQKNGVPGDAIESLK